MGPDLGRAFVVMVALGFVAGGLVVSGLPWLWGALVKPFLRWLVL